MKPITQNKLTPQIQFSRVIELDSHQTAILNHLVLTSQELSDDEALDLWQSLNPFLPILNLQTFQS